MAGKKFSSAGLKAAAEKKKALRASGKKEVRTSMQERAGITFPVWRLRQGIKRIARGHNLTSAVPVQLAAVLEFLVRDWIEAAANVHEREVCKAHESALAKKDGSGLQELPDKIRVNPHTLQLAKDSAMSLLVPDDSNVFVGGGVQLFEYFSKKEARSRRAKEIAIEKAKKKKNKESEEPPKKKKGKEEEEEEEEEAPKKKGEEEEAPKKKGEDEEAPKKKRKHEEKEKKKKKKKKKTPEEASE